MRSSLPYDPWAHRRGEPRLFVVLWSCYLLGASIVSLGAIGVIGVADPDVYRPAAALMLSLTGLGLAILWPMVRLSQVGPPLWHRGAFFLDGAVVLFPALIVLIAQCMPWMAAWPIGVAIAIGTSYTAWTLLIALTLTFFFLRAPHQLGEPAPRLRHAWIWMVAIVLLANLGPALAALLTAAGHDPTGDLSDLLLMTSPITAPLLAPRAREWAGQDDSIGLWHILAASLPLLLAIIIGTRLPRHPMGTRR